MLIVVSVIAVLGWLAAGLLLWLLSRVLSGQEMREARARVEGYEAMRENFPLRAACYDGADYIPAAVRHHWPSDTATP